MEDKVVIIALIVSILSLSMSLYFWRQQFRPIITLAVRTESSGNIAIAYSLHVKNSGSIPAKNISLTIDESSSIDALGNDATDGNLERWLRAVNKSQIHILQNGDTVTCSFGTSEVNDNGFWKYGAVVKVKIKYFGWFGREFIERQSIKIQDSNSFTGYMWGAKA